jgi:CheY-like chemotaxis protein
MTGVHYGRLKLLFVDDAAHTRLLLREMLRDTEWPNVAFADSAAAALRQIKIDLPDLVFTDWQMPGESGIDLIRAIRERPDSPDPLLPVILLTASGGAEHVLGASNAGAADFLVKPISRSRIIERVISATTRQRPFIVSPSYIGPERRSGPRPGDAAGQGQDPIPPSTIVLPPDGLLLAKIQGNPVAIREAQRRHALAIEIYVRHRSQFMASAAAPADASP